MPKIQSYGDDEKSAGRCAIRKQRNVIRNIAKSPLHQSTTCRRLEIRFFFLETSQESGKKKADTVSGS
jgi:hypothetical protein